jgi:hypothetical protein
MTRTFGKIITKQDDRRTLLLQQLLPTRSTHWQNILLWDLVHRIFAENFKGLMTKGIGGLSSTASTQTRVTDVNVNHRRGTHAQVNDNS